MANNTGIKTGGRQAGTPNRLTNELRATLKDILAKEYTGIPVLLEKLEPKDRLDMIVKLSIYVLPKVDSIHFKENEPLSWT
jgi:hypothetical protein